MGRMNKDIPDHTLRIAHLSTIQRTKTKCLRFVLYDRRPQTIPTSIIKIISTAWYAADDKHEYEYDTFFIFGYHVIF